MRAPNLELRLVHDDVFPHATLVNDGIALVPPPTPDQVAFLVGEVFPEVLSPVCDADVVNVQPLGATCPLASYHLRGWMGAGGRFGASARDLRLGPHSATLTNPFPFLLPADQDRERFGIIAPILGSGNELRA